MGLKLSELRAPARARNRNRNRMIGIAQSHFDYEHENLAATHKRFLKNTIMELLAAFAELLVQLFIELIGHILWSCLELPIEALSTFSERNKED